VYKVNNIPQKKKNAVKQEDDDEYKQNKIYKLKYYECNKVYVGQIGRHFKAR
jgi:hypothetical protein